MLLKRIISAVLLLGSAALLLFLLPAVTGVAVLMAAAVLGLLEFYGIMHKTGIRTFRLLGIGNGLTLMAGLFLAVNAKTLLPDSAARVAAEAPLLLFAVIVFAVCVRQFPQKDNPQPLATIAGTMMGILYVPFLLAFIIFLAFRWEPVTWSQPFGNTARALILYLVVVVKSSDIGAFVVGRTFGRHKLFPRISPGKTWEGLAGGLVAGVLMSGLIFWWLADGRPYAAFGRLLVTRTDAWVLGAVLSAIGVVGDLIESLLKRSAGLKDSGCTIPGMGGILDVLDSLLFAAPALYFYLLWLAKVQ